MQGKELIQLNSDLEVSRGDLVWRCTEIAAIENDAQLRSAREVLGDCKTVLKAIDKFFEPLADAAHKAHKAITARRADIKIDLASEATRVQKLMDGYLTAQRIKQEAARRAEEQKRRAEAEEEALRQAEVLEEMGNTTGAENVLNNAHAMAAPVKVQKSDYAPEVQGLAVRERWTFEVIDRDAVPRQFLMLDEKKIKNHVETLKQDAEIPGLRIYPEVRTSVR